MPPDAKARKTKPQGTSSMSHVPPQDEFQLPKRPRKRAATQKEDWIASNLRHAYDDTLEDKIPQSMMDLLNALDDGSAGGKDDQ